MKLNFIALTFLVIIMVSCKSRDGDYSLFTPADDLELGKKISAQIESDPQNFPILGRNDHQRLYIHLENIVGKIIQSDAIFHREELAWKINIIDNDTIYNAFCIPGGYIYVYTGLIRFVESEDELAGVIAHEIAHADLRHSTDQLTKAYGLKLLASILIDGDAMGIANIGMNLLQLTFSRSDESEADMYAVRYLTDTDYNPVAFAYFFEKMQMQEESLRVFQFLSTHPDPGNRIEKIKNQWKNEGLKKNTDHSANFRQLRKSLP